MQIDGYNSDMSDVQKNKLREAFPEVFSENKIDFDKLRLTLGEDIHLAERYGLSWNGKTDVFAKVQEKTVKTLHPRPEDSVNWDSTQNMFIEGDNLDALKVLHKSYYGKIKMIYIDPPYNTGKDFVYNDDFQKTKKEQALEDGAVDEDGNITRDDGLRINNGGHKHSNWLDMMYPRLFIARNLLRQDGVIFVSIDDNEVHNLRLIMNEIFGEDNFVAVVAVNRASEVATDTTIQKHEYLVCYSRNQSLFAAVGDERETISRGTVGNIDQTTPVITFPAGLRCIDIPDGTYESTRKIKGSRENIDNLNPIIVKNGRLKEPVNMSARWRSSNDMRNFFKNDCRPTQAKINGVIVDIYLQGDRFMPQIKKVVRAKIPTLYLDNKRGSSDLERLDMKEVMDYPKAVSFIKYFIKLSTRKNDIILDFFAGSGTTGQAVYEANLDGEQRQYICIQLPEFTGEESVARKAGFDTIAEVARERIRRAISVVREDIAERSEPALDLGFRSYTVGDSNFKKWNELVVDASGIRQATLDQINSLEEGTKDEDLLTEILLKRGISPLVEIVSYDGFMSVVSESIIISLSRNMTEQLFTQILTQEPSQIILLDEAFNGDVNLKTNLILQAEKQNIVVEVV